MLREFKLRTSCLPGMLAERQSGTLDVHSDPIAEYAMAILGIIPARLESQRLPGKLLLSETGKPLLQHTWEAVRKCSLIDRLVIATDSAEIRNAAMNFGATVVMTGQHDSGTSRIAEAVGATCSIGDIVVNVQGDEPRIHADVIESLVRRMQRNPLPDMGTVATDFRTEADRTNPACVKVTLTDDEFAVDFFRSTTSQNITDDDEARAPLRHVGLYAYSVEFLQRWNRLAHSDRATALSLEQLRPLDSGIRIAVTKVNHDSTGIDTREQYDAFVRQCRAARS